MVAAMAAPRFRRTKRPIDKSLKFINKVGVAATQVSTTLIAATFPCTLTGLRWDISGIQDGGTGNCACQWALVIVRDGLAQSTMATSDAASFYDPEQDVLTFGTGLIDNNNTSMIWTGATKTMRKMKGGDELIFIVSGVATNTTTLRGVIQFFCKT